ncbi:GroES-like protein [Vararia minispora EC-137]|uniref:GroES-like protein n=1 Tax=Vararia minispora EC-137 TaxID=1314806 RepID=A0ACB8Q6B2_9AGAM|nr:GroES-like protein [Vararia minispora EC-137]
MSQQQKALIVPNRDAGKFSFTTRDIPKPGSGEVLVRNIAIALNPVDAITPKNPDIIEQFFGGFPATGGYDGAGVIHEIGEGVSGWSVGDKILYQCAHGHDYFTFQEYTLTFATRVAKIPANVTFDQAATLPLALATAAIGMYEARSEPGAISGGAGYTAPWEEGGRGKYAGQPIIISGGASSVGQFAIQLAKLSGFDPIITTSSASNTEYCKAAGATHVINYKEMPPDQLPAEIRKVISEPFQFIVHASGDANSQKVYWDMLANGGTLVTTTNPSVGKRNDVADDGTGRRNVSIFASINEGPHVGFATRMYAALTGMLEHGELKPNNIELVSNGLAGVPDALERYFAQGVSGVKLVARLSETP